MKTHVDVVIIGAGSAGLAALRQVEKHTDKFVIVNDGPYGTTCARVGCMPSKALIEAANAYHHRHRADAFGIRGANGLSIDIPAVMQRVRSLRDHFVSGVVKTTQALGDKSIAGRAKLSPGNIVEVNEKRFVAKRIIIATGSRPIIPAPWLALGELVLTTDTFFDQKNLPARMAVVGLGAVGIEMAQALSRLGIEVFAFNASNRLAGISDPLIAKAARTSLENEFRIYTGNPVELSRAKSGVRVQAGAIDISVDRVLVAIGRQPNIDDLGLDALGVKLDKKGMPSFNRNTLQIENLPLFIAGDVNGDASLLHEAADEGYAAGVNAIADTPICFVRRTPLAIVFSEPGIARVGQPCTEIDPANCLTGTVNFSKQGRALTAQRNKGLLRIYAKKDDGRLLGAEMCAPAAEHLAHLLALAIQRQLTAAELLAMPFYHPVLEEGVRTALREITKHLAINTPELGSCNGYQLEALD